MGTRLIRSQAPSAAKSKNERRTIATIIAAVVVPLILVYLLVAADIRADLSELKPIQPLADPVTLLVGWSELENPAEPWALRQQPRWAIQPHIRMLGYMMDATKPFREGALVGKFLLLPDAGQLLHPAHRIADQMIEVRPERSIPLSYRHLVWVTGKFTRSRSPARSEEPVYVLTGAQVSLAADGDITHFFSP